MSRIRSRLVPEAPRQWTSVAVSILLGVMLGPVAEMVTSGSVVGLPFVAAVYFGVWSVYCLVYSILTWIALRSLSGGELRVALTESESKRRRRKRTEMLAATGGPVGAVTFCGFTILAVIAAATVSELRENPLVIGLAVLVVASSWLLIVVVYSVHYARENTQLGGLIFADADDEPEFTDYVYLAVQVSTSFTGSDVVVGSRPMRREVTIHSFVAFVFNTVTIALLVSLLIATTS